MSFGENLRYYRKQKKLTQWQLADLINAKHNSVSDWELDKKLDKHDWIEGNNPELFNALEKMKTYRIISFVFILSYLILFALLILGISQKELF